LFECDSNKHRFYFFKLIFGPSFILSITVIFFFSYFLINIYFFNSLFSIILLSFSTFIFRFLNFLTIIREPFLHQILCHDISVLYYDHYNIKNRPLKFIKVSLPKIIFPPFLNVQTNSACTEF